MAVASVHWYFLFNEYTHRTCVPLCSVSLVCPGNCCVYLFYSCSFHSAGKGHQFALVMYCCYGFHCYGHITVVTIAMATITIWACGSIKNTIRAQFGEDWWGFLKMGEKGRHVFIAHSYMHWCSLMLKVAHKCSLISANVGTLYGTIVFCLLSNVHSDNNVL